MEKAHDYDRKRSSSGQRIWSQLSHTYLIGLCVIFGLVLVTEGVVLWQHLQSKGARKDWHRLQDDLTTLYEQKNVGEKALNRLSEQVREQNAELASVVAQTKAERESLSSLQTSARDLHKSKAQLEEKTVSLVHQLEEIEANLKEKDRTLRALNEISSKALQLLSCKVCNTLRLDLLVGTAPSSLNLEASPTIHNNSSALCPLNQRQATAVFFRAVFLRSLRSVSSPFLVICVCQTLSPQRSANWSMIRRVSLSAFFEHCDTIMIRIKALRFHQLRPSESRSKSRVLRSEQNCLYIFDETPVPHRLLRPT